METAQSIRELVSMNRLEQAIDLLQGVNDHAAIALRDRLKKLNVDNLLGFITPGEYLSGQSRIAAEILNNNQAVKEPALDHQTQDQIVAEFLARLRAFTEHDTNTCPYCGLRVFRLYKIGRCVYAYPCQCRLWQAGNPGCVGRREVKHKTFQDVRAEIVKMWQSGATLRKIADHYPGVSYGTIKRILKGHEPKTPAIRYALGMTVYQPAPVCPIHGIVHMGRCPREITYKRIADMPAELLRWKIEHREIVSDEA